MFEFRGGRDNAGYRGVSRNKFKKELPPTGAIELNRPCGQGFAFDLAKQAAALIGAINQSRDTFFPGNRQ